MPMKNNTCNVCSRCDLPISAAMVASLCGQGRRDCRVSSKHRCIAGDHHDGHCFADGAANAKHYSGEHS